MDPAKIRAIADAIALQVNALYAQLVEAPPTVRVVKAGEDLQAALDAGGALELEAGAQFTGSFTMPSGTRLTGQSGSALRGTTAPAILILPGAKDISLSDLTVTSQHPEVIRLGENSDAQTKVEDAPSGLLLTRVVVPSHRGKRAFSIHCSNLIMMDCQALDVFDPGGQDSQAINIGNAPGLITISGGKYSAGSEIFLMGGDTTKIPNLTPFDVSLNDTELSRPLSWKTDGVARKIKNIFEVKNGRNVRLTNSRLSGCWAEGQQGEAIVLTPALDGAIKNPPLRSGEVRDVLIEDVEITDCASVANLLGRAYSAYTVNPLSGVVFRRVASKVSRALYGGRGQLAIIQGEPDTIFFDDVMHVGDGTSTIYYASGTVIDPSTLQSRPAGKINTLTVKSSHMTLGQYGFMFNGNANAAHWQDSVGALDVQANFFTGSTAMKTNLPNNTYVVGP